MLINNKVANEKLNVFSIIHENIAYYSSGLK